MHHKGFEIQVDRDVDTGLYMAYCPDVVGCAHVAPTAEEAVEGVRRLLEEAR